MMISIWQADRNRTATAKCKNILDSSGRIFENSTIISVPILFQFCANFFGFDVE